MTKAKSKSRSLTWDKNVAWTSSTKKEWKCNWCKMSFKNNSMPRLAAHLTGKGTASGEIGSCQGTVPENELTAAGQFNTEAAAAKAAKEASEARRKAREAASHQPSIKAAFGAEGKDVANSALIDLIAGDALAFRLVESPRFKHFVAAVAAAGTTYTLPNRKQASTVLLDKAVERVKDFIEKPMKEQQKTYGAMLMSDGVTTKANRPMLNWILVSNGKSYVSGFTDTSREVKTAAYIAEQAAQHITPDVDMVVMDGANASALKLLEEQ